MLWSLNRASSLGAHLQCTPAALRLQAVRRRTRFWAQAASLGAAALSGHLMVVHGCVSGLSRAASCG